ERARCAGEGTAALADLFARLATYGVRPDVTGIGSIVCARRPGDGSAREQAASCQKVLGGWANLATEYATKRYRSNLINWGMLPLTCAEDIADFTVGEWLYLPGIRRAIETAADVIEGYVVSAAGVRPIRMTVGALTADERKIVLDGCLINHCRA
ncbi:MAG: hydratase, partial [Clostridia bacterium]|nr:hydratase [Clostridia bacterium]